MLSDKNILIGITGSIAVYKMCDVVSQLKKLNANVDVIMTENATKFVSPLTFESLAKSKCVVDTFDRNYKYNVEHISLAKKADLAIIAPATANIIGKVANGIADDMLSTTINACACDTIIAPAMNEQMYKNPITQENISKLKKYGYKFIDPACGLLACCDEGIGKLADVDTIVSNIKEYFNQETNFKNKKIVVTAGPTIEPIDSVRYITNYSSGKMGYAIAEAACKQGADVTLISGQVKIDCSPAINKINVVTAQDMFEAVKNNITDADILIMSAAVADYTPKIFTDHKIKKANPYINIELSRTQDILKWVGENKTNNLFVCGFCMETEKLIERAKEKLKSKNADMIVANSISDKDSGFQTDTNKACILTKNQQIDLPLMKKSELAKEILTQINKAI